MTPSSNPSHYRPRQNAKEDHGQDWVCVHEIEYGHGLGLYRASQRNALKASMRRSRQKYHAIGRQTSRGSTPM
jgi:hypothetical protein